MRPGRPGGALARRLIGLAGLFGALLLWTGLARIASSLLLPGPFEVGLRLVRLFASERLGIDLLWTLLRVVIGTGAGALTGFAIGLLLSHSRLLERLVDPTLQVLRPVSPFAWTPLVILFCGLGNLPALVTIGIGIVFPAAVSAVEAVRSIPVELRDITRVFGAAGWTRLRLVELPLIRTELAAALRVLFGVGWILATGAEMLAANSGLGYRLMNARYLLDFPALYALILTIGLTGFLLDRLLQLVRDRTGIGSAGQA